MSMAGFLGKCIPAASMGWNVSRLNKRDYIWKQFKDAKQEEMTINGLQTMTRRLETLILRSYSNL